MNQKCPSCGNYVEGKKINTLARKVTRGAVKKGATMATGAAIGSVIPGIGTAVGAAVGLIASEFLNDTADEMYDAVVDEIEYEFTCPKCGRKWTKKINSNQQRQSNVLRSNSNNNSNRNTSSNSNTYSQPSTPRYDNTDWNEIFLKEFDFYLESTEKILSSKDCVKQYVNDLKYKFAACHDDAICSEFHFLRAFACLQYSLNNSDDKSLILLGRNLISTAINCLDDEEYKLASLIFEILAVDTKIGNAPNKIKKLQQSCPNILTMENTIFKTEYWQNVYEEVCYNQLLDVAVYNEEQNKEGAVIDALQRISELADIGYKLFAYSFLSKKFMEIDPAKSFDFALKATAIANFEKEYNPEIQKHRNWLDCLNILGYCYGEGVGTEIDYDKAFGFYYRCARLSHPLGMANLAECYELGYGVSKDIKMALEWYKKAADAGVESAKKKLEEFNGVCISSFPEGTLSKEDFYMDIEDSFGIEDRGVVITGQVKSGTISVGDKIILVNDDDSSKVCQIIGIEMFRKLLDICEAGDNVGLLIKGIDIKDEIRRGAFVEYYDGKSPVGSYLQNSPETSSGNEVTSTEQEYLDELKACLEEDGEISPKERRLLERFREKLGISAERAKELEESLSAPQLTDAEKEYLEEYKACIEEDGEISPKERRLLNRIRESLGISEERANEIEKL